MKHIGSDIAVGRSKKPSRDTERCELMRYFRERLNRTRARDGFPPLSMARMGKVLELIPTKDLYYLKRVCDDTYLHALRARDAAFSKRFWWEVNPKKHEK